MTSQENKVAIASYALDCVGVSQRVLAPLKEQPVGVSITVLRDTTRQVGCPYLSNDDLCLADNSGVSCIHLHPGETRSVVQEEAQTRKTRIEMKECLGETPFSKFMVRKWLDENDRVTDKSLVIVREEGWEESHPRDIDSLLSILREVDTSRGSGSTRCLNSLMRGGFWYIKELQEAVRIGLFETARHRSIGIPDFGQKSLELLTEALGKLDS